MNSQKKAVFSNDGEYFAFINEQGSLKIWETTTNVLKQDSFMKRSVRFSISSVIWGPFTNEFNITDKSDGHDSGTEHSDCQCLVIGTIKGEILLFDFMIGKFYNHFIKAHKDVVTDLCWHTETNCLYSCSKDKCITMWDIAAGKIKLKWEADDKPLNSICVIDQDNLLAASSSVTWWNIKDQTIVKKFQCIGSEIYNVIPVLSTDVSSKSYFITVASEEPIISAWRLSKGNNHKAVATFALSGEVKNIDVTRNISKSSPMMLSTVLKSGHLCLYQHILNGRCKKNLAPICNIQVVTKLTHDKKPSTVPIVACKITSDLESCIVAYGSFDEPTFEKINTVGCPKLLTITPSEKALLGSSSKESEINSCDNQDYLSANGLLPVSETSENPQSSSKSPQKCKDSNRTILSMTESFHEFEETPSTIHKTSPHTSPTKKKKQRNNEKVNSCTEASNIVVDLSNPASVAHCLLRGLETEDIKVLSLVLQCDDKDIINKSVPRIPLNKLKFCLTELYRREKSNSCKKERSSSRKWLIEILNCHLSYIIEKEELASTLKRLRCYLEQRNINDTILKLSILNGLLRVHRQKDTSSEDSDSGQTDQRMET